ncbi:MAG: hypothetical protein WCT14_13165 [Treponemataceae bacterium]
MTTVSDDRSISFTASEMTALFLIMKAREGTLDSVACTALEKLEKYLYAVLSIEEMENLVREASR